MTRSSRSLAVSASVAILGIAAIDFVYGRYAQKHFGPNATLTAAEEEGTDCLVTLGDSRMAAGIDAPILQHLLQSNEVNTRVAPLAIGALPISGQAMALRRFIADGYIPRIVVLGASVGTLLDNPSPDPNVFVGNRAAELAWSIPSDLEIYYPGFPATSLDSGVRFSFARSNALSIYASSLWLKTQGVQDSLVGKSTDEPHNRFGSLADMHALFDAFRGEATKNLAKWDDHWRLSPWFEMVRRLAHACGARLIILEVPMPSSYRAAVIDSPAGHRYSAWLRDEIVRAGDTYIDLSATRSVDDDDFGDGVHLDSKGARHFSGDLGFALAPLLRNQP